MNPLTNVKNVLKLSESELKGRNKTSWHDQYRESAWIFIGGLSYDLTEGDLICVFSQYGEPVNVNLVRDKASGKSKGFCFLCYADQRSTDLAVDNLNGIKLLKRTLRVDHVNNYRPPKDNDDDDEVTKKLKREGLAGISREQTKEKERPVIKSEDSKDDVRKLMRESRRSRSNERRTIDQSGSSRHRYQDRKSDQRQLSRGFDRSKRQSPSPPRHRNGSGNFERREQRHDRHRVRSFRSPPRSSRYERRSRSPERRKVR